MLPDPATRKFIEEHLHDDIAHLALASGRYPGVDVRFAVGQIKARKAIQHKIPSWFGHPDIIYPVQLSIEQSSSEQTALFKSSLLSGKTLIDMTGGFGVDASFLSGRFENVIYIERNEELCKVAAHNFNVLGLKNIESVNADAVKYLQTADAADCIYIDPARRDAKGRKIVSLKDCEPDVTELLPLLLAKANVVLVKASPMLDISKALLELQNVVQVFVAAVDNECKELLFLMGREAVDSTDIAISAVNFSRLREPQHFSFTAAEEQNSDCCLTAKPEQYLYEPNAAILKAGAFKITAKRYGLKKLHTNSHLYTSNNFLADFPGRVFSVESYFPLKKESIREHLSSLQKANITIRNFPESVESLRKKLKLKDGGDVYLFATTLADNKKVLIKTLKAFY